MNFEEKTLTSEYVYNGKVIDVRRDDIEVSNGHKSVREVVEHSGGVTILAVKDNGNFLFVRQYRYPIKSVSLELPAGKLEKGEDPDFAAKRELEEETNKIKEERGFFRYNGISWPSEVEFQDGTIFYQTGRESVNSYKRK